MTRPKRSSAPPLASMGVDGVPVYNKTAPPRGKITTPQYRIVDMCSKSMQILPCQECGARRYSVGNGKVAKVFTPHRDDCPVLSIVYVTPERLTGYARRKASFYAKYHTAHN